VFLLHMNKESKSLETIGVGGSLDQESTPFAQVKKSYNPK